MLRGAAYTEAQNNLSHLRMYYRNMYLFIFTLQNQICNMECVMDGAGGARALPLRRRPYLPFQ